MARFQSFYRVCQYSTDFLHRGGNARVELTPNAMSFYLCVIKVLVLKCSQEVKRNDANDYLSLILYHITGVTQVAPHSLSGLAGYRAKGSQKSLRFTRATTLAF